MKVLDSFAPTHLENDAKESGFFQCPTCGLVWFGRSDVQDCPQAPHGSPVHVAILCRICDVAVPLIRFADHLKSPEHQGR